MLTADLINAMFELAGAIFVLDHCRIAYRDKVVAGVSLISVAYFLFWGIWNLFYYPSLAQSYSFYAAILLTSTNALWVGLLFKYKNRSRLMG